MVDSIATVALETLRDLLVEEAKFLSNVSGQVEEVRRNLSTMHSFLQDADNRKDRYDSNAVRNWVANLRDLSMKAESVLETYAINKSRRRGNSLKQRVKRFTCILSECLSTHEIGKDMEDIRSRMVELTKRLDTINYRGASSSNEERKTQWSRKTYGDEIDKFFVGMEEEIKSLLSLVTSDEISHRVILISGMGGLGKTTLAKKIYQYLKVRSFFQAHAWVCISQQFDPKVVFQGILKQLLPNENVEQCSNDELVTKLYEAQRNKKCLVVLDDIWEVEHWDDILSHAFPIVSEYCKVLLTSRNENILTREHYLHKLRYLSEDEGCELLQKIALPANYAQELRARELEHLKEVGKGIVKKCGYLPLAIAVIGGILRQESSVDEWKKVEENIDSYLQHGIGMENNERVTQILDLSYNALPYNLKPCFLYLGVFPEDEEIYTEKLYSLWMAEGMISSEDIKGRREVVRDVAERYLKELANRCMVQVKKDGDSPYNRFRSCRLHDLMRDLCLLKGKEEEFLHVVDKKVERQNISSISRSPRLVVYSNGEKDDYEVEGNQKLRSLLLIEKRFGQSGLVRFGEFRHLKTLILKNLMFKNKKLPKGIEKLILLKLLHIDDCYVDELPLAICNLSHLQYLFVHSYGTLKMHNYLYRLSRLKSLHLVINYMEVIGGGKLNLHGLNELEILYSFDCQKYDYSLVESLQIFEGSIHDEKILSTIVNHILSHEDRFRETSLTIWRECNLGGSMSALLCNLFEIRSLVSLRIGCHVRNLPTYKCPNLTYLGLEGCEIEEDPMVKLGKLPKLKRLSLRRSSFVGKEMTSQTAEFPQLRFLWINYLPNLEEWTVGENSMPLLAELHISNCEKLKMIPNGLKFNINLQRMEIMHMPAEFQKRVKVVDGEEGADWHKIKHIPLILIE